VTGPENPPVAETELLIACATWERTPARTERGRAALRDIGWERWIPRARAHRLIPHAHRQLESITDLVPQEVRDDLHVEARAIGARALAVSLQLGELARSFDHAGVTMIAYKGPALAEAAYGDIGVRASVDLDIVVPRDELDQGREVLQSLGYGSRSGMTPAQERALQGAFGHYVYSRDGAPSPVELHWSFASSRYPWRLPPSNVALRASRLRIGTASVLVPERHDEIFLQAMHGARHQWEQLEWLVAFAELLGGAAAAGREIDVKILLYRAELWSSKRPLLLGARLAHELLGAPIPGALLTLAGQHPRVVKQCDLLIARLYRGRPQHDADANRRFCLDLIDRRTDRVRFLAAEIFVPTEREWEFVQLPRPLLPLYFPIRLVRLVTRALTR
jgi:hypothetical protein